MGYIVSILIFLLFFFLAVILNQKAPDSALTFPVNFISGCMIFGSVGFVGLLLLALMIENS